MFQPDQTTLQAWAATSALGTMGPSTDINRPQLPASSRGNEEQQSVRSIALTLGFTILLFVLALVALTTSSTAGAHAAVAAPPVFCEPAAQTLSVTEADIALHHLPNRSWIMCVQPHARDDYSWLVRWWIRLRANLGPPNLQFPCPDLRFLRKEPSGLCRSREVSTGADRISTHGLIAIDHLEYDAPCCR